MRQGVASRHSTVAEQLAQLLGSMTGSSESEDFQNRADHKRSSAQAMEAADSIEASTVMIP